MLTRSGYLAAAAVGAASLVAGWQWAAVLILYFVASTSLSRLGAGVKERRAGSIVAKTGARDAIQVLANGGLFAAAAVGSLFSDLDGVVALGLGSLAASAADSWATEIGTLIGGEPRSILTLRRMPVGTSGGVTFAGTMGALLGAAFVATSAHLIGWTPRVTMVAGIAGFIGAITDSLMGASFQARRWCDDCDMATERMTHRCGATTRHSGGIAWLDNDLVNLAAGLTGGLLAMLMAIWSRQ